MVHHLNDILENGEPVVQSEYLEDCQECVSQGTAENVVWLVSFSRNLRGSSAIARRGAGGENKNIMEETKILID